MRTTAKAAITKASSQSNIGLAALGLMAKKKLLSISATATIRTKKPFCERMALLLTVHGEAIRTPVGPLGVGLIRSRRGGRRSAPRIRYTARAEAK